MAGIIEIEKNIKEKRDKGKVLLKGQTSQGMCIVIKLDKGGILTQFGYHSDLRINDNIVVGSNVKLINHDEYQGEWVLADD